jgi:peroxiredoxin
VVARAALSLPAAVAGIAIAGSCHAAGLDRVDIGKPAPQFTAKSADGGQHSLHDYAGKLVVLEWTNPVCPFTAVKYKSGAMQELQRYAAGHGIVWLAIDTASPDKAGYLSIAAARTRIAQTHAAVTAFLFDRDGNIARSYGAKVTPSFFIVDRAGKLAYQGAMDDQVFADQDRGREHVKSALTDLLAGHRVETAETKAQGCAIEY